MKKLLMARGLSVVVALLGAGCAAAPNDGASQESAIAAATVETADLARASKGDLSLDGTTMSGDATFATYRFWGNVGEKVRLRAGDATELHLYRAYFAGDLLAFSPDEWNKASHITGGAGSIAVEIQRSGIYYVTIGSPASTSSLAYTLAGEVDRRPETSGVRAIVHDAGRTCAILESGAVKCWGFYSSMISGDRRVVGARPSDMGAGLPSIPLPRTAVALSAAGGQTTVLLDDGTVFRIGSRWTHEQEMETPAVPLLSGKHVLKMDGACALLAGREFQCWGRKGLDSPAPTLRAPFTVGREVVDFAATDLSLVTLLDDGTVVVGDTSKWQPSPAPLELAAGERPVRVTASTSYYAVITNTRVHVKSWPPGAPSWGEPVRLPPGEVATKLVADELWSIVEGGRLMHTFGWAPAWGSPLQHEYRDAPDVGGRVVELTGASSANYGETICARLDDGRVKCFGAANYGALGLGDTVSRDQRDGADHLAFGQRLPALDLGAP